MMVSDHLQFLATLLPTENCCWVEYSLGNTACLNTVEDKRVLLYRLSNPTFQPAVSHCALILSHTERGESKCCLFQYSAVWTEMWATSNFHYSNFWDISVTASWSDFVAVHRGGKMVKMMMTTMVMTMTILIMMTVMVVVMMIMYMMIITYI